ncbi:hypothetical protein BSKO_01420 [Bryopsis sp. KO-2023]|nr:hypothetical protein BSKO_01420 [Bryopsis sp. KO-2023]
MAMDDVRPPEEVLKEPDLPPSPILSPEACQIVVGVLEKYVHLGKGWKKRLFVLQRGVLRYYKIEPPTSAPYIPGLVDGLNECGELRLIGNELPLLDKKLRSTSSKSILTAAPDNVITQGELHLQVATFRDSKSGDNKRFTIFSGTKKLSCRAESELDKKAWLEAMRCAKESWGDGNGAGLFAPVAKERPFIQSKSSHNSQNSHHPTQSVVQRSFENVTLPAVKERLEEGNVSSDLCRFMEEVLVQQHRFYINYMKEEAEKRKQLIRYIAYLEEDKRQLEQQLVVRERQDTYSEVASIHGDRTFVADPVSGSEIDNDEDRGNSDDSDDDQVFFDCYPLDQDTTSRPLTSYGTSEAPIDDIPSLERVLSQTRSTRSNHSNGGSMKESEVSTAGPLTNGDAADMGALSPEIRNNIDEMESWLRKDEPHPSHRDRLPKPKQKEKAVSLWSIIKSCVGKDLTRVCLPVFFNEPVSALQKSAEDMEYSELLDKAVCFPPGSVGRLLHIAAFAVSGYAATEGRTTKPFNPLLGETFELVHAKKGFRFIGEKVIHHPTVFAFHCEGRGWSIDADGEIRNRFWGAGIELRPVGCIQLHTADGEVYQWNKVVTSVNNLILGKLYLDHYGMMKVRNLTAGIMAKIKFVETSRFFDRNPHQVRGHVEDGKGKMGNYSISGSWSESLTADFGNGPSEIWRKSPPPPDPTRYNLSTFAIVLNELVQGLEQKIAPTDCRLRPDQRFLELGMYDEANAEKQRLEHKQRAARKAAEEGEPIRPRWFEYKESAKQGEEMIFKYKGGYWESRDRGNFEGCRDIFGQ